MKSSVSFSYLLVVLIWSTTPLAIKWSSESIHPSMAVLLRMAIAVVLGLGLIYSKRITLPWHRQAIQLYSYSGMGIFLGMSLAYTASAYIPSGTMSLIFGLSPIVAGVFASRILGEARFSRIRKLALAVSLLGLAVVSSGGIDIHQDNWFGLVFILLSMVVFSLSSVLVKSVPLAIHPIATTVGALIVSLPFFIVSWLCLDGTLPLESWQPRAVYSILYLGVFGSLIGFVAYYYILQKLPASSVALITLLTPVIAMTIGSVLNDEVINSKLVIGASCVMLGLALYHFGEKYILGKQAAKPV